MTSIWTLIKAAAYIGMLILLYVAIQGTVSGTDYHVFNVTPAHAWSYENKTMSDQEYEAFCNFVAQDQTRDNKYIQGKFMCLEFAIYFMVNASKQGFYVSLVNIKDCKDYPGGHYADAVYRNGRGMTVIDPQLNADRNIINKKLIGSGDTIRIIPRDSIVKINSLTSITDDGMHTEVKL